MLNRVKVLKTALWTIVGVWAAVSAARFLNGLGVTTGLNDAAPWGIWIAFDVMAGVALAAGGFVIAATVYIFGLEKYRPFVRPAILTAFLGYVAVAVGLLYDLGLPWHIWHPMIFWQEQSVLFEVAMCVMLYLTVLALEFSPVALEHPLFKHRLFQTVLRFLKKITILLVIAGIVLSTLHQSSLGSLFLITPYRLHPLWYSPYIYVFFFISAIGLGLMMVSLESLFSAYFFRHEIKTDLLSGLGLAASGVLGFYVIIRLVDLALGGKLGLLVDGSWQSCLFIFELAVSAVIPAALLAIPKVRQSAAGMTVCAIMTILGMVLYRIDVCLIAFERPEGMSYFPAWTEIAVSLGVVSGAVLVFIFFVENLKVYEKGDSGEAPRELSYDPATLHLLSPRFLVDPRRYSLFFVAGAAIAVGILPRGALLGYQADLERTPVFASRSVRGLKAPLPETERFTLALIEPTGKSNGNVPSEKLLIIDGNRDGRYVLFDHNGHQARLGENQSCGVCHHQNIAPAVASPCHECHRDMYEKINIFNHASHILHMRDGAGCAECHLKKSEPKNSDTAKKCLECHEDTSSFDTFVHDEGMDMAGLASSYMTAMHNMCMPCHEREAQEKTLTPKGPDPALTRCDQCHGETAQ